MAVDSRPLTSNSMATSETHLDEKQVPVTVTDPPEERLSTDDEKVPEPTTIVAADSNDELWETDPANPRNWRSAKKWTAVLVVSLYCFVTPLASSMMAPGIPEIAHKYAITSPTILNMTLSVFLLSLALGPLLFAPLSEMYGRTWVLHISNVFTVGFSLGCAFAPDVNSLIGLRLLAGFSSSAPMAIGAGTISDVFAPRDRAAGMALFTLGPLIGPVIGPVAGGFIVQEIGVKYVFVVLGATSGLASLIGIPLLRETYAPVIRMRRALKAGDAERAVKYVPHLQQGGNVVKLFYDNIERPIVILFTSLICLLLSLYTAFCFGIFFLMFATFAGFFQKTYGFQPGVGGLAYLGLGLGFASATIFSAKVAAIVYNKLSAKNGGEGTPEMRLPVLIFGSFFIPVGLFWYGWSAHAQLHWMMPITGSLIFGFGLVSVMIPVQLYIVDSYVYAASAIAGSTMSRGLLGFAFPLFGQQMFDALGLGPGNSLLGGLAIVLGIPFPIWLYFNGERLRARNPLTNPKLQAKM